MKEKYKSITELLAMSSAHGYSNIVRSKRKCQKTMWIFFTLIATSMCFWFIVISFLDYLSYEVFTNVEYVFEQPTQFPTVTFCSSDRKSFNHKNLSELIQECYFAYDNDCEIEPYNHFEKIYSENYKTCYRFNSGVNFYKQKIEIKNSTIGGRDDSFRLRVLSQEGLNVWIHNHSYELVIEMFDNHNSNMNLASAGTETQLIIDKTIETKLEEPYNKCLKDVRVFDKNKTLIDFILKDNKSYTQMKCLDYCYELDYYNNNPCNCTALSFDQSWEYCYVKKSYDNNCIECKKCANCTINYKKYFYTNIIAQKCSEYCPLECDSVTYLMTVDSNLKSKEINKTYLIVYFRSLKFLVINQLPKITIVDLVSNIGGIIGVFIGISFLSVIEILEIIFEFFFILNEKEN